MDLSEGWHSGRVSAGVLLLLLYSESRNSEVLHRLQWLLDLVGKELSPMKLAALMSLEL